MQDLRVVVVRSSKPLRFCFGEQGNGPRPRTQMLDRPTIVHHTRKVSEFYYTLIFSRSKVAGIRGSNRCECHLVFICTLLRYSTINTHMLHFSPRVP